MVFLNLRAIWVKFPHSTILLLNKSVFPVRMYCFCRCFPYPRTECIMLYGAVRKFNRNLIGDYIECLDPLFNQNNCEIVYQSILPMVCYHLHF